MDRETYNLILYIFVIVGAFAIGMYCGKKD